MSKAFDFKKYIQAGLAKAYRAHHIESIKRGIKTAKERKQKNANK